MDFERVRNDVIGVHEKVPVLGGNEMVYVNFDNAASTPTVKPVVEKIKEFLRFYSNVHRGIGFKSQLASKIYDEVREDVIRFVNANPNQHTVIFCMNTTAAINKLAHSLTLQPNEVVLTTIKEHHSNELPWRKNRFVDHIRVNREGYIDLNDFKDKINYYGKRVRLVAISGASNITGLVTPIEPFVELAKMVEAEVLVDGAQLVSHKKVDMQRMGIDYLVFSAHKMYAPFGVGVMIGKPDVFLRGDPDTVGGGTVDIVTMDSVYWAELPDREEAGTPNVCGVVALSAAIRYLETIGFDWIEKREQELVAYLYEKLGAIDQVRFLCGTSYVPERKVGVVSFNVENIPHSLVAAILSYEGAIGVRNGCFCAHPYLLSVLNASESDMKNVMRKVLARDRTNLPGAVRVSFGIYNDFEEIDRLIDIVKRIVKNDIKGRYRLDHSSGAYFPKDFSYDFERYFSLS